MSVLSSDIARALASHFGLIVTVEVRPEARGVTLFFVGSKANETTFKAVRGALLTENEGHEFPIECRIPGVHGRGYRPHGADEAIYLTVIGDPSAAEYALMRPAMRG